MILILWKDAKHFFLAQVEVKNFRIISHSQLGERQRSGFCPCWLLDSYGFAERYRLLSMNRYSFVGWTKSRGFNLEDTHMTAPEKIEKLLFVLAIAFCWSYKIGVIKDVERAIPKKKHGRPFKSLFRVGLDCFRSSILFIEKKMQEFRRIIKILRYYSLDSYRCLWFFCPVQIPSRRFFALVLMLIIYIY